MNNSQESGNILFMKRKMRSIINFLVFELKGNVFDMPPMFTAALFAIAKTRKQPRRYGTYIQWNITQPQKGMKLGHFVDEPRDCHTE